MVPCEKAKFYINRKKHRFYEIDAYIKSLKIGFEYDGLYWHSDKYCKQEYHATKTKFFEDKGIAITHIFSDEWEHKQEIVKDKIRRAVNETSLQHIPMDKCMIREIDCNIARLFYNENHIAGAPSEQGYLSLGIYHADILICAISFMKTGKNYTILRYAERLGYSINGLTELLKYALDRYDATSFIAYADRRWPIDDVYAAHGFTLDGILEPSFYYVNNHRQSNNSKCNYKIFDCGKSKYYLEINKK